MKAKWAVRLNSVFMNVLGEKNCLCAAKRGQNHIQATQWMTWYSKALYFVHIWWNFWWELLDNWQCDYKNCWQRDCKVALIMQNLQFGHPESTPLPSAMSCYKTSGVYIVFLNMFFFVTVSSILLLLPAWLKPTTIRKWWWSFHWRVNHLENCSLLIRQEWINIIYDLFV